MAGLMSGVIKAGSSRDSAESAGKEGTHMEILKETSDAALSMFKAGYDLAQAQTRKALSNYGVNTALNDSSGKSATLNTRNRQAIRTAGKQVSV